MTKKREDINIKKYVAEFIGTMVLVIFGRGSAVAANTLLGNVSGCHINPAVSLAMLISKRMGGKDFVGYVVAQFLGGIAGAGILCVFFGSNAAPLVGAALAAVVYTYLTSFKDN